MYKTAIANDYLKARYSLFKWRYSLSIVNKIALAFGMAAVTGLTAQIKVPLPWTPVPITAQTFVVLIAAVFLGKWWGGVSQLIYIGMGAIGIPWFAGWSGGYSVLTGPTGGYLCGFVLATLFIGHLTDKYIKARNFFPILGLMFFANFVLIHIPGLLQLSLYFYLVKGTVPSFWKLLWMGSIPFIAGDITKIVAAAVLAKGITPKKAFD